MNWIVDPYGLFGISRITGFNALKPAAATRNRTVKPIAVGRVRPTTLIVGNSRPEIGINPESKNWPKKLRPVYNLGVPGASIYSQMRYAQHAIAIKQPKLIIWGLDFVDFLNAPDNRNNPHVWPPSNAGTQTLLRVDADFQPQSHWQLEEWKNRLLATLSIQAFTDSVWTVASQHDENTATRTELGFNPAMDYLPIIAHEGAYVLFKQKNAEMRARLKRTRWRIHNRSYNWSAEFEAVRRLLGSALEKEIKMILFINPYHADYLDLVREAGLWQEFEKWKLELRALAQTEGNTPLWDFSGYDDFSTESAPTEKTAKALRWFWEPAHYRKELGELMIQRMLIKTPGAWQHGRFGTLLCCSEGDKSTRPSANSQLSVLQASLTK